MADSSKITIDITGMTCAACEARVQKSASAVGGVECAAVNLLKNSMELTFDGSPETLRAVCEAIEKAGYGATPRATSSAASTASQAVASEQIKESASKAVAEMRFRLVVSMAFSIPLFYVAMGPMFGWPEIPGLAGMQGMGASALTQLLLCIPILVVVGKLASRNFLKLSEQVSHVERLFLLARDVVDNLSLVHHDEAVSQANCIVHVVGNHQRCEMVLCDHLLGKIEDLLRSLGVERCGVLVEQE